MRNRKRMDRTLASVKELWVTAPDLRLCQLLGCLTLAGEDLFYLEDDVLVKRIERRLNRYVPQSQVRGE